MIQGHLTGPTGSTAPPFSDLQELSSDSVGDTLLRDHEEEEPEDPEEVHRSFPTSPVPLLHRKCDITPCSAHHTLRRMPASPKQQAAVQPGGDGTAVVPDSNRGSTDDGQASKSLSRLQMKRPPPINTCLPLSPTTAGALNGGLVAVAQAMGSPLAAAQGTMQGQAWAGRGPAGNPQQQVREALCARSDAFLLLQWQAGKG
jgi:hypothetical protein